MKERDYAYRGWILVLAVILAMAGLSFVPSFNLLGLTTEKVDLLSDLREKGDAEAESDATIYDANFELLEQELKAAKTETADSLKKVAPVRYEWIVKRDSLPQPLELLSEHLKIETNKHQMPIEDFDTTGVSRLDKFVEKLIKGDDVRVAFLGDSFVEGDIITVDMREQLQQKFGGRGVGFVPCALPFDIFRTSVQRQASGWSTYSLLNAGEIPAAYKSRFSMAGYLSAGRRGATVRWKTTNVRPHLDSCSRARIFVTCRTDSKVELTLNDTLKHEVVVAAADYLRELYVEAPVSSIRLRVLSGEVLCHGASIEGGRGAMVDNLSMRGNSGQAIFGASVATNMQLDKQLGYDMIVLEYGLNAMQPGQRNFSRYKQRIIDMVKYCQRCFPDAAIVVLGVSDRAVGGEGGWRSINSVTYLGPVQRDAAKVTGACFWDLGKVVLSYGGIGAFVRNGWAAHDHTHLSFKGGARIAESFVQAIQLRAYEMLQKREGINSDMVLPIELEPWRMLEDSLSVEDITTPSILILGDDDGVASESSVVEAPIVETPRVEEPMVETESVETAKADTLKTDSASVEERKVEEPTIIAPIADTSSVVVPKIEKSNPETQTE